MLLRTLMLALLLIASLAHGAGSDTSLPGLSDLKAGLMGGAQGNDNNTGSNHGADEEQQAEDKIRAATKKLHQEIDSNHSRIEDLKQQAAQAPRKKQQLHDRLHEARQELRDDWAERYQTLSLPALGKELDDQLDQLAKNQHKLADVASKLTRSRTSPDRARTSISDSLARIDELQSQCGDQARSSDSSSLRQKKCQAEIEVLKTRIELRNQELSGGNVIAATARLHKRLLEEQAKVIQKRLDALQPLINRKRAQKLSSKIQEEQVDLPPEIANQPLFKAARNQNEQLGQQLQKVGAQTSDLMREGIAARTRLDQLRSLASTVKEQVQMIKGSLLLSRILYEQQKSLPSLNPHRGLDKEITETRLAQFNVSQARQKLEKDHPEINAPDLDNEQLGQLRSALARLLAARYELLDQLDKELGHKLNEQIQLQLSQQQSRKTTIQLRETISEQTFWMPSTQNLSADWLSSFPKQVNDELKRIPWQTIANRASTLVQTKWPWLFVPLLSAAILLLLRKRLLARLRKLNADIGFLKRDGQLHTPLAILYTALTCAPGPLALGLLAAGLRTQPQPFASVLGAALLKIGLLWLVFALCYRLLAERGIALRHFRWTRERNRHLRRRLLAVGLAMVPMTLVIAFGEEWPAQLTNDRIGLLVMVACLAILSVFLARAAFWYPSRHYSRSLQIGATAVCAAIPVALIIMIGFGYYYTSVRLSGRLIDSFYLLLLWILSDAAAIRGLAVAAQRLSYKRAVAQLQANADDSSSGIEGVEVEEPKMDLEQVNQQSLRLIRLALFAGFGVLLYLIWADILSAFSYTNSILLWNSAQGGGTELTSIPISLGDVITAVGIGVLTVVLASNLPGLLEVLILSRLTLRPGTSYATTTLLSYLIVTVGVVVALSSLGLSWHKLQWLIAALGVGLGFGLQEIFANFVSGIIILFERPIRIGDIITLNNLSGTVSRIHIRATTLIDFDRKEIIVPNKAFVTERLVNWTLSDTVIRVTLKVGFAYGSNLDTADALLHKVAQDNARVLRDPAPLILFMAFSDNALNYELRVYLNDINDILYATDELNHAIDKACREQGVEVAFNQVDVHLRTAGDDFHILRQHDNSNPRHGYHYGDPAAASRDQPGEPGSGADPKGQPDPR